MESRSSSARSRGGAARPVFDRWRACGRSVVLIVASGALAACLTGDPFAVVVCAAACGVAAWLERRCLGREVNDRHEVAISSARTEAMRKCVADRMSMELAHERSRSVLEALREGVVVVDDRGEIVIANPAARAAMRNPQQDPCGSILWEVLADELADVGREAHASLCEEACADGAIGAAPVRLSALRCGGVVFDVTAVRAVSPRTGQRFGSVFLFVDTTSIHELHRIKDRFLSNVSHELRTPLTNVIAYAEIVDRMNPEDEHEWREFVRVIHEESLELSHLIDGLFDYLQLESGEARFDVEPCDGGEVVAQVCGKLRDGATGRGVSIELQIGDDLPTVAVDRARWTQVVGHLVGNAIKFSPDGQPIRVSVAARDGAVELRVDDGGPGIPSKDRESVFEKFHQLGDHVTDKVPGTGIGLATSRAIVARSGGVIWIEDSPLGGACFVVRLPAAGQPRLLGYGGHAGF